MKRDFNKWFSTFRDTIATWKYYTDFDKVYKNTNKIKDELNILAFSLLFGVAKLCERQATINFKIMKNSPQHTLWAVFHLHNFPYLPHIL